MRASRSTALAAGLALALGACAAVGPAGVRNGRSSYAAALSATESEQVLAIIVAARYGEVRVPLALTSISAGMRMTATVGGQAGIGPDDSFSGNLVPLSGELAYEETPTIVYTPVQGDEYVRALGAPVPLDLLVSLLNHTERFDVVAETLIVRMNGLHNPDFADAEAGGDGGEAFRRAIDCMGRLVRENALVFVQTDDAATDFGMAIFDYDPHLLDTAKELLQLLDVPVEPAGRPYLVVPLHLSIARDDRASFAVLTRSIASLLRIAAARVDVPEEDLAAGRASPPRAPGLALRDLVIHCTESRPDDAAVATEHDGRWFYIDDGDYESKRWFLLVQSLLQCRIASGAEGAAAPTLTIPTR
jgi:hypothetical protein